MPRGHAGAPSAFVPLMHIVIAGLHSVRMYLDDVIVFGETAGRHLQSIRDFAASLEKHNLKLAPAKVTIGSTNVSVLGHRIRPSGVRPDSGKLNALANTPMPTDVSQLRSLLGGLSCYRKVLPNLTQRLKPVADLLKRTNPIIFFTEEMERLVRSLLRELSERAPSASVPRFGCRHRRVLTLPTVL